MKLGELYCKSLEEVIKELELSNVEVHSDDDGNVRAIELKYIARKEDAEKKVSNREW